MLLQAASIAAAEAPPLCATTCPALRTAAAAACAALGGTVDEARFTCATDPQGTGGGRGPCVRGDEPVGSVVGVVRTRCAAPAPKLVWSAWLDRDDPSGQGDFERVADFTQAQIGCARPKQIEARASDGTAAKDTGQVLALQPGLGLTCKNAAQSGGKRCLDYRIRFGCEPAPIEWSHLAQAWHEDHDNSEGAVLVFVPKAVPLEDARFRAELTFAQPNLVSVLVLHETDAHYIAKGTWSRTGNVLTVQYRSEDGKTLTDRYEVLELGPDLLRLKKQ